MDGPPGRASSTHRSSMSNSTSTSTSIASREFPRYEGDDDGSGLQHTCSTRPPRPRPRPRPPASPAEVLPALHQSDAHLFRLQHCRDEESAYRSHIDLLEESCRTSYDDLYQLLAMFVVVQGVVISAVAQSTILNCHHRIFPLSLSFTASLATIIALVAHLAHIGQLKDEVERTKRRADAAYGMMEDIKLRGVEFDLSRELDTASGAEISRAVPLLLRPSSPRHVFSVFGVSLLAVLLLLSMGIMVSCTMVLCRECKCKATK